MSMKKDYIAPILSLSLICLIISGALALTNNLTEPVVANAAKQRAENTMAEIIPEADGFQPLETDGLPPTIKETYRAANGAGYIIIAAANGYGGEIKIIVGLTADGAVIQSRALEHSETKGLGSKIEDASYSSRFNGLEPGSPINADAITGATISSNAYAKAISDALEAFMLLTEEWTFK